MKYARIIGTGGYLPPNIFTNADWEERVATTDEWIVERTGIKSRHIAGVDETAASMGTIAAQKALESANVAAKDIELILVATGTPDKIFPATACLIQKNLKIPTCIAFDIQAACSGFVYALSIAEQYIKSGTVSKALIVCSELMSRLIDWSDRSTCVLFGDGAGAVILEASSAPGILATGLYADGNYDKLLYVDNQQLRENKNYISKTSHQYLENLHPFIQMQGQRVFKLAVAKLGDLIKDIQLKHKITLEEIDWLIPHQANMRIIQATADKLHLPMEKVICTVETHSNTSSASIPLALDIAVRDGRIKKGQTVLFEAIGGGLTWGFALAKL
ncbi:MAG: ketoacyl-ACP synthase III [Proteobacteria bacterium]|nr:ketoacyl-ACP synthase III [Pseudomonadota bacterium]